MRIKMLGFIDDIIDNVVEGMEDLCDGNGVEGVKKLTKATVAGSMAIAGADLAIDAIDYIKDEILDKGDDDE